MITLNSQVTFTSEGKNLSGTVERIVKYPRPFSEESKDPNDWTAHVNVQGDLRTGGTYQVKYSSLLAK